MKRIFKKALFAFFKKEIMELVGYDKSSERVEIISKDMRFTEIRSEVNFTMRDEQFIQGYPPEIAYEKALQRCKEKLFEESMKFVKIDQMSIMDSHVYDNRSIRVSLFVGVPEN